MSAEKESPDRVSLAPWVSRSQQGFTLVEALVVAVIFGILAAVAIPTYSGYIKSQKKQSAAAVAQTASVTAAALLRRNPALTLDELTTQLNATISLPNPSPFQVTVVNHDGSNYVHVVETSDADCTAESKL